MVNLKSIISPTIESQLRNGKEMTMKCEEQKSGEFPPLDRLFEREDNLSAYKKEPILNNLIEHYQPFFEKGIDYLYDGKIWNVYPSGSLLWYFNEALSLCTKLSIDPCPEEYFIDQYYDEIGGERTEIECYFILSIVYALLAVNWNVRRQHAYSDDIRSPIPMISVHSFGNLLYRRQS